MWEMDESFSVTLSQPSGARLGVASADITLTNDDPAAVPNIADLAVDEGNDGTNEVIVTVTFDRPVPELAMLWYQFLGGAAVAGQDFRAARTTLYPQPGAWQMTFPIEILPDTQPECDEGFFLRYGGYYGIDEATRSAKILIRDDDGTVADCGDPFASAAPPEGPDGGGAPPAIEQPNDGGSMPDVFIIHMPIVYEDAAAASADASDAGSGARIKAPAGCACAIGRAHGRLWLLLVAVTGMGIALTRRRGRR